MIRHIVAWRLKAEDAEGKARATAEIAAALEGLQPLIPEIKAIRVSPNVAYFGDNFDVVLIADYESVADLEAYQVHPDHQLAVAIVRERVSARACVDIEL
jgi:hypothetical protein